MATRRAVLGGMAILGAGFLVSGAGRFATPLNPPLSGAPPQTRAVPSSAEPLPVIGMGTSGSFDVGTSQAERDPLREVLKTFFSGGSTLIDTAPGYGRAETVLGDLLAELGLRDKAFLATKLAAHGRQAGLAQFQRSLDALRTDKVELLQVHTLQDWQTQLALINDLKAEGKTRYSGVTHYLEHGHAELAAVLRQSRPDFVQVNYSVSTRGAEKTVFPVARELGVAVLVNRAFDDGKLFARVQNKPLPGWAADVGIMSWAQAFLRFALSDPAVTAVIPATGRPTRQRDNLLAGFGEPLNAAQRQSLIDLIG